MTKLSRSRGILRPEFGSSGTAGIVPSSCRRWIRPREFPKFLGACPRRTFFASALAARAKKFRLELVCALPEIRVAWLSRGTRGGNPGELGRPIRRISPGSRRESPEMTVTQRPISGVETGKHGSQPGPNRVPEGLTAVEISQKRLVGRPLAIRQFGNSAIRHLDTELGRRKS